MTDKANQTDFGRLRSTVELLNNLINAAESAMRLPADRERYASILEVSVRSSWGSSSMPPEQAVIAQRVKQKIIEESRAEGVAARNAVLEANAREIEALRAIIPSLAAKAAVDLGVLARAMLERRSEP